MFVQRSPRKLTKCVFGAVAAAVLIVTAAGSATAAPALPEEVVTSAAAAAAGSMPRSGDNTAPTTEPAPTSNRAGPPAPGVPLVPPAPVVPLDPPAPAAPVVPPAPAAPPAPAVPAPAPATVEPPVAESGAPDPDATTPTGPVVPPEPVDSTEPSAPQAPQEPQAPVQEDPAIPPAEAPAPVATGKATLVIRAGGDRIAAQAVGPLAGVLFNVYAGTRATPPSPEAEAVASCTTGISGTCSVDVDLRSSGGNDPLGYWAVQQTAPTGWFLRSFLNVGPVNSVGPMRYRHFIKDVIAATSYDVPVTATGSETKDASSGINALSRLNPPVEPKCGLSIAVLMDLSGSIGGNIGNLRAAATGFANSLAGTPSKMAIYTFAGAAPAWETTNLPLTSLATTSSTKTVTDHIARLNVVDENDWRWGTNWDQGLWQIAESGTSFDLAVVLTDGNPTLYGPNHEGPIDFTRFRELENAVFSANALKARGTKVISAGIGNGVSNSVENLKSISGLNEGDDYFTSSFTELEEKLAELAGANCNGTISVVKKVIAPDDTPAEAQPAGGWTFTPATLNVTPASGITDPATGATNFAVGFGAGVTSRNVTIHEAQLPGYTLAQVGGANAVCSSGATSLPVTNAGVTGFTVAASPTQTVTCTVLNRAPVLTAQVRVEKLWTIDGVDYANDRRPSGFSATLQLTGPSSPQFGNTYTGYIQNSVVTVGESVTVPPGCVNVPSGDIGAHILPGGSAVFTLHNTVTCQTKLTLVKQVHNAFGPEADPTAWTLGATKNGDLTPTLSGSTGSAAVSSVAIEPGVVYVLTESGGPSGYAQERVPSYSPNPNLVPQPTGSWHCRIDGSSADYDGLNGGVTVQRGQSATCTVLNRAVAPKLTLVKSVNNGATGGTAVATDWNLTATQSGSTLPALSGVVGAPEVTSVSVSADVDYVIAEDAGPSGYQLTDLACVLTGTETSVPVSGNSSVRLAIGQDVTCALTNAAQQSTLTLVKTVNGSDPDPASSWTLSAQGPLSLSGPTGTSETTQVPVPLGSYALSESGPTEGYIASDWVCEADSTSVPVIGAVVSVALGKDVTCAVTNTAQPTFLRLLKTVENSHGGLANASDWVLSATGPTPLSGSGDVSGIVAPGSYTLTEAPGVAGYEQTGLSCWVNGSDPRNPVAIASGVLVLTRGQGVACEFINSDLAATLTLEKMVSPGEAGGALDPASAWTLSADGPTAVSGPSGDPSVTAVAVSAGTYALGEDGPSGYEPGTWQCDGGVVNGSEVTITNGVSVYCAITNTAISPHLTLVKDVENSNGGTSGALDWNLSADGPSHISGASGSADVTSKAVEPGSYALSETGPEGYELYSLVCETSGADPVEATGDSIDLGLGDNVVCTFTNRDSLSQLKIVKQVDGNDETGGTAVPENWTLTASVNGEAVITADGESEFTDAQAGQYTLSEAANNLVKTDGYTTGTWECLTEDAVSLPTTGIGDPASGTATVGIPLGAEVTCTIINTAQPSQWTIVKTADPATGSTVIPGAEIRYTLTLTKLSGVAGTDIAITDDLSEVLNNAVLVGDPAFTASTGTVTQVGDLVTWTVPTLTATATLQYGARVADGATGVTLRNVVTRGGEPCIPEEGDSCMTEHFTPEWTLAKSSNPASGAEVLPGSIIEYTLTVTNTGPVAATGLTIVDDLTDLIEYAEVESSTVAADLGTWELGDLDLAWTIPSLEPGPPATLTYSVTVNSDAWDASIKNAVIGSGDVPPTECAPSEVTTVAPTDEASCGTMHPTPKQPKLAMIKAVDNGNREEPASPIDWTLTATPVVFDSQPVRSGPGGFVSTAVLPGEFSLTEEAGAPIAEHGFAPDPWQCVDLATETGAGVEISEAGTVQVAAGADVVCTIVNRAVPLDLAIAKSHTDLEGSGEVVADPGKGQQFRYHLVVTNADTEATGVSITDAIPASLTVDIESIVVPDGWNAAVTNQNDDGGGGILTASYEGVFAANATAEITFDVTVGNIAQPDTTVATPDIENTACVTATEDDSNPENDCSTDNVPVKSIVLTALAVCRADTPWLDYSVTAVNYVATEFTVRWWNTAVWNNGDPTGAPSAETPIPVGELEGSLLWPGAVLDANGKIIEWPGWRDGGMVEDPTAPGGDLRPSAVVQVVSNPSVESRTVYPPPTPNCNANPPLNPPVDPPTTPPTTPDDPGDPADPADPTQLPVKYGASATGSLPRTGMDVAGLLGAAAAAILVGVLILRRRRV